MLNEVWGAGRVGVHLAPRGDEHDMGDDDPRETFGYALEQLGQRQIVHSSLPVNIWQMTVSVFNETTFGWCAIDCQ